MKKQLTPNQIERRFPQKKSKVGRPSDVYELKYLRYLRIGTIFKRNKDSKIWWKVEKEVSTKLSLCISTSSGKKELIARATKVFTKRYKSAF